MRWIGSPDNLVFGLTALHTRHVDVGYETRSEEAGMNQSVINQYRIACSAAEYLRVDIEQPPSRASTRRVHLGR